MANPETATNSPERKRIITGFRPTSDLTVGNYLGAIKPVQDIVSDKSNDVYVFVADLHGLTDHDPRELAPYRTEVIHDARALGLHQVDVSMYLQSDIEAEVVQIANRISPYIGVGALSRTPNLREKVQAQIRGEVLDDDEVAMRANAALLNYPVLMAADIFAQQAPLVAVGQDQEPHLELAREIARRFNRTFDTDLLVEPQIFATRSLRVLALNGMGKMSKSNPSQAIIFTDDPDEARAKIKKATTASAGEWNEVLESHFTVAEETASTEEQRAKLAELRAMHLGGAQVMGDFKDLWGDITEDMLVRFQRNRTATTEKDVEWYRQIGTRNAQKNAQEVLKGMKEVMGF